MAVFFQFIAAFALFFGLGGLVYATEVSKRCQQLINDRMNEIDMQMTRKAHKQDRVITGAVREMRDSIANLEALVQSQSREINILRKMVEPLVSDFERRAEQEKKVEAYLKTRGAL